MMGAFKKPRRRQLSCAKGQLQPTIFAVTRVSWFKQGKVFAVREYLVKNASDNAKEELIALFKEALQKGADVCSIMVCNPADIGIDP